MNEKVIDQILDRKIIVILRGIPKEKLIPLAEAMYAAGIRLMEYTYSSNGAVSDEHTAENINMLVRHFQGRMHIGAGTVSTEKQVQLTADAGGRFIISPDTNPEIIKKTKALGMVSIPGAVTPTEINTANRAGADFVKLFPITSLGTEYVKAVTAPISNVRFLAVGGIDDKNMILYYQAGVCGFGVGSNIVNKEMLANNDYDGITEIAKRYTKISNNKRIETSNGSRTNCTT